MIIDFDALAKWIATRKVKAVAAWCARNRIYTFRDHKGRPCTTLSAIDEALRGHARPEDIGINWDRPTWASSRAVDLSPTSSKVTGATAAAKRKAKGGTGKPET
jgi:hypothetical protein